MRHSVDSGAPGSSLAMPISALALWMSCASSLDAGEESSFPHGGLEALLWYRGQGDILQ